MPKRFDAEQLAQIARNLRVSIIEMLTQSASGHPGGSLSIAEIMSYLYFHEMNIDPAHPEMADRDRFVLSKGHAAPALYAVLAERGFFPKEDLMGLRQVSSHLQGHPHRLDTPGVEASTGSLGQGLSMAVGMAMGLKRSNTHANVFCVIGDGESQEGQIWEAAMTAGFHRVANLCVFLDYNNLQIDGNVSAIKDISPVDKKWEAFGWQVLTINGHDFIEIHEALRLFHSEFLKPTIIIAKTIKGKGVSFMENQVDFHGVAPTPDEKEIAIKELMHV